MGLRGRCTCLGLCVGLVAGVLPGVLVVLFVAAVVWVQGFVQPVLGVDEVFDEPEGGAARVEVGTVGGLGQVVDDFIGGVQQPLCDGLDVVEEFAEVVGLAGVQDDTGLGHDRDPFLGVCGHDGMTVRQPACAGLTR